MAQQAAGGADEIGQIKELLLAFRMGDHLGLGVVELELEQGLLAEGFMDLAAAGPEGQVPATLALDPAAQVLVWGKQDRLVSGQLVDQVHRVAAGADQVALGLHRRRTVDVAHHDMVGMGGAKGGKGIGWAGIGQAAARIQVWQQHGFARVEDFGRFGHEMDAAKDDDIRLGGRGFAGEFQGIANEVGDVLDGWLLVVVGQDHGLALALEGADRLWQLPSRRAAFPDTVRCGLGCREDQVKPQLMHSGATLGFLDGCDWGISRSKPRQEPG